MRNSACYVHRVSGSFFFFFGLMLIGTSIRVTQKKKSGKTFFKSGRGIVGEFFGQECHCRSFNSAIDFCCFTTKGIFIHGRMVEFFSWWMATPEKLEFALVINYATCVDKKSHEFLYAPYVTTP